MQSMASRQLLYLCQKNVISSGPLITGSWRALTPGSASSKGLVTPRSISLPLYAIDTFMQSFKDSHLDTGSRQYYSPEVCADKASTVTRIKVQGHTPTYSEIRDNYIAKNIPFILTGNACYTTGGKPWKVFEEWLCPSGDDQLKQQLDIDHIVSNYGTDMVPVADCHKQEYGAHPKTEMAFAEYLSLIHDTDRCLYLKDYHFMRLHEDKKLYETPIYFTSDWLNEYCIDKGIDDYRFIYLGATGSWTPFHADVLRSFSWSANILGRKLWILYPPGKEDLLKDKFGNLPFNVAVEPYTSSDNRSYKHRIEVVQNCGEIIFVPSGWHHQVHNLEMTLSINHNWFNGCSIENCWEYLRYNLSCVEKEIYDCKEMDNWQGHCQTLLRAHVGFNYTDFLEILEHIADKRLKLESHRSDKDLTAIFQVSKHCMLLDSNLTEEHRVRVDKLISRIEDIGL